MVIVENFRDILAAEIATQYVVLEVSEPDATTRGETS